MSHKKVVVFGSAMSQSAALMVWRILQAGVTPEMIFLEARGFLKKTGRQQEPRLFSRKGNSFSLWHYLKNYFVTYLQFLLRKLLKERLPVSFYRSVEELALDFDLKICFVEDHNDDIVLRYIEEQETIQLGVLINTRPIDNRILRLPKKGCINLQLSSMPHFMGYDALAQVYLDKSTTLGLSVYKPRDEFFRGGILLRDKLGVCPLDSEESLYMKALWLGSKMMVRAMEGLFDGNLDEIPCGREYQVSLKFRDKHQEELIEDYRHQLKIDFFEESSVNKVAHVVTRMTVGGAQSNTYATVQGNRALGYKTVLFTGPSWDDEGEILTDAVKTMGDSLIVVPGLIREIDLMSDVFALKQLWQHFRRGRFDIVHTHMSKGGLLGRLAAKLAKVPVVIHTPHGHVFHSYFSVMKVKVFLFLEKHLAPLCQKLIALTENEKREHVNLRVGEDVQWAVIPSGVKYELDSKQKNLLQDLKIDGKSLIVGYVGRLTPIKGPEYLVNAIPTIIENFSKIHFIFVGDGEEKQKLQTMIKSKGCQDKVTFVGKQTDVKSYMNLFDVLVVPSLNEGMGRVIVEAGFLKKPVVASEVGGISNLIQDNRTGLLVPPKAPEAIAVAVTRILKDTLLSLRLGENLHKKVVPDFTEETMVSHIHLLYENCLIKKGIFKMAEYGLKQEAFDPDSEKKGVLS